MRCPQPFSSNMRSAARFRSLWVALVVAASLSCNGGDTGGTHGEIARVTIPAGSSFRVAVDSLAHARLVGWPRFFRIYAKMGGHDRGIKAGTYAIRRGLSWSALLDALTRGQGLERPVTIPEGFAISEISALLVRTLGVSAESMHVAVRDSALRRRLDIPTETVEGYLFPDTYQLPYGTSARAAVDIMVQRFETVWRPEWDEQLQKLAMSRHDIVTLASIIEKEARLPEERPVISAVYHNRLRAQMPLQADPTIQYALGAHHARVLYRDLEIDSPYNTYRHPGLPPGPIASPGRASLEAALYPAAAPYLFFVAHPDGHHEFRTTFQGHAAAIKEVRRERGPTTMRQPPRDSLAPKDKRKSGR